MNTNRSRTMFERFKLTQPSRDPAGEGRRLFLQQPGEARAGLFAMSETQFFLRVVDASVTFTKDASGGVTALVLHQQGDHVGKRVK
jgi:hypothetical protein